MNNTGNIFAAIGYACARNASGADLAGADLRDADLRDADLAGAYLTGAYLRDADLAGADLRDAYLRDAYLRNAYLHGADLHGASLRNASLRNADLRNADLRNADLAGAYLTGAHLTSAYLAGAKIINTRGLVSVSGVGRSNRHAYAYWTGSAIAYRIGCRDTDEAGVRAAIDEDYAGDDLERAAYHAAIDYLKVAFEAFMKRWSVGRYYQASDEVTA